MLRNRTIIIFSIITLVFVIFSTIVIVAFDAVKNNTIDRVAMAYLWNDDDIKEKHGEIIHVGRNVVSKTEKTANLMNVPYTVETSRKHILVYVKLQNKSETWIPISKEIKEVIKNVD